MSDWIPFSAYDLWKTTDPGDYDPEPDEPECCVCGSSECLVQVGHQYICEACEEQEENNYDPEAHGGTDTE